MTKPKKNTFMERNTELPQELHISTLNNDVFRYSYNLGIFDMAHIRTPEMGKTLSPALIRPGDYSEQSGKLCGMERSQCSRESPSPKLIKVEPAESISSVNDKNESQAEEGMKVFVGIDSQEQQTFIGTALACTSDTAHRNSIETTELERNGELCDSSSHIEENYNSVFTPPIAKFRRAARRLGVRLPASDTHCRARRNGICEVNDDSAEHRTLLRILNKRF